MSKKVLQKLIIGGSMMAFSQIWAAFAPHVPGEIVVKLKQKMTKAEKDSLEKAGLSIKKNLDLSYANVSVFKFDQKSQNMNSILSNLNKNPNVEIAEPNFIYKVVKPVQGQIQSGLSADAHTWKKSNLSSPTDPRFGELWGLRNTGTNSNRRSARSGADIKAVQAWGITKGSKAVRIAVIDTGIDYNHPDLRANMWINQAELNGRKGVDDDGNGYKDDIYGYDFANKDGDPMDGNDHGTHCAGTIGAVHNNGIGVAGVMADVELVAVKFLGDDGSGSLDDALLAIDYATKVGVDIMSNSWGGGGFSQTMKDAIVRARDAGIIFTAAAGNTAANNDVTPHYPANYQVENVISVAAHNSADELATFSCYGKKTVHIAAPGRDILSTVTGGNYNSISGTSMATPHVSGALGLLLAKEGRMDHLKMRERLMATSVPVRAYKGKIVKGGRLNAYNLLTDTRPERNEPKPDLWQSNILSTPWETNHPYGHFVNETRVFKAPAGAKFMRIKITRFDIEQRYDYIELKDKKGDVAEKISGAGEDYFSEYVEGNEIVATFKSDRSIDGWGFLVEEVQWQ